MTQRAKDFDEERQLGEPGKYPYTRGVQPTMYRGRLWTMRQYAGFGTAEATNQRFKFLLEAGQTGLSCAFDLPTQMGYDSDHVRAEGEVGKVGVAIDSLEDMRLLLAGLPLDEVTTSMTINSTAATLLLFYQLVAEEHGHRGRPASRHDPERHLEGVRGPRHVHLPAATLDAPRSSTPSPTARRRSPTGTRSRSRATTSARPVRPRSRRSPSRSPTASPTSRRRSRRDWSLDDFAPQLSFFLNAHNNLFEEVAKYRAARRMWASIMRERFGAKNPKSMMLRFHTQTGGSTLTAQQPENNIVRVTLQALAAALGGTQSLHTNGFDEALGLPTEHAAKLALRTQQIVGYESGIADTVDPLAGSYFVESLTDEVEERARQYIKTHRRDGRRGRGHRGQLHAGVRSSRPPTTSPAQGRTRRQGRGRA